MRIDGEKHRCERDTLIGCLSYVPQLGTKPSTQVCTLTRNQTGDLSPYTTVLPATAELWSERRTLGCNQEVPLQAFMGRADGVHSGKRQTKPAFLLSIYPLESRKSIRQRKNRYTWRNSWEVCILSAVPQVTESDTFMIMLDAKQDSYSVIQVSALRVCQGLVGIKNKGCQTSNLRLQQQTFM